MTREIEGVDVFVSYAHADNEVPEGSSAKYGWVTTLARNLNVGLNVYKKNLFIDHQLRPGDDFGADLIAQVQSSALLVVVLSQNYIDSRWCGKELHHFMSGQAVRGRSPRDIFVIEVAPYERLQRRPESLQELRASVQASKFWYQPLDASAPIAAGYPTPKESGPEGENHYWTVLNALRSAIDERLRDRPSTVGEDKGRC